MLIFPDKTQLNGRPGWPSASMTRPRSARATFGVIGAAAALTGCGGGGGGGSAAPGGGTGSEGDPAPGTGSLGNSNNPLSDLTVDAGSDIVPINLSASYFASESGGEINFSASLENGEDLSTVGLSLDENGRIVGRLEGAGTVAIRVIASNENGDSVARTVNITAENPAARGGRPRAEVAQLAGDRHAAVGDEIEAIDVTSGFGDPDIGGNDLVYAVQFSREDHGLSFDGTTNEITGTLTGAEDVTVIVTITNGEGGGSVEHRIVISANQKPVAGGTPLPANVDAVVGQDMPSIDLGEAFSDPEGTDLTFMAQRVEGSTLTALTGTGLSLRGDMIEGAPSTAGTLTIRVTATDANGAGTSREFTVTVMAAPNRSPAATSVAPATVDPGADLPVDLSTWFDDPDSDTLTYSATARVGGRDITLNSANLGLALEGDRITGSFTGSGDVTITVTATDGAATATHTFTAEATDSATSGGNGGGNPMDNPGGNGGGSNPMDNPGGNGGGSNPMDNPDGNGGGSNPVDNPGGDVTNPGQNPDTTGQQGGTLFALHDRTVLTGSAITPISVDGAFRFPAGVNPTFSFEVGSQSGTLSSIGLGYDQETGLITGIIANAGAHAIIVNADDGNGGTQSKSFGITAVDPDPVPVDRDPVVLVPRLSGTGDVNETRILADGMVVFTKGRAIAPIDVRSLFNDPDNDELTYEAWVGSLQEVENPRDARGELVRLDHANFGLSVDSGIISGVLSQDYAGAAGGEYTDDSFEIVLRVYDGETGGVKYAHLGLEAGAESESVLEWGLLPTFNVKINTAPLISETSPLEDVFVTSGQEILSFNVSAGFDDPDADSTLSFSVIGLDGTGLSFSSNMITGTFTNFSVGESEKTITVTATDEHGAATSDLVVLRLNSAPETVVALGNRTVTTGQMITIGIDAAFRDADGDDLEFSFAVGNQRAALDSIGLDFDDRTGVITGTITDAAIHEITVTAVDGKGGTHSQSFTIAAEDPGQSQGDRAPEVLVQRLNTGNPDETRIYMDGDVVFTKGEAITPIDIKSIFNDPDNDVLTFEAFVGRLTAVDSPSDGDSGNWTNLGDSNFGLSFIDGVISGTLSGNYAGAQDGAYTDESFEIVLRVSDPATDGVKYANFGLASGRGSSSSVYDWGLLPSFTVNVNTAPRVSSPIDDLSVVQGQLISPIPVAMVFDDPDPGARLTYSVDGLEGTGLEFVNNEFRQVGGGGAPSATGAPNEIIITATDEHGASISDSFEFHIYTQPRNSVFDLKDRTVQTGTRITPIAIDGAFDIPDRDDLSASFLVINLDSRDRPSLSSLGLEYDYSTGLLTGTIANAGMYNITAQFNSTALGRLSHQDAFTITAVDPDPAQVDRDPVVLAPRLSGTGDVNETRILADDTFVFTKGREIDPIDFRPLFNDPDNDALTYEAWVGSLEERDNPRDARNHLVRLHDANFGLSVENGVISGTLSADYAGVIDGRYTDDLFEIVLRVYDGFESGHRYANLGLETDQERDNESLWDWGLLPTFNVKVNTAPMVSAISPLEDITVTAGSAIRSFDVSSRFEDPDIGAALTFSVKGLEGTGLTFVNNVISGTFGGFSGGETQRTIFVTATDEHGVSTTDRIELYQNSEPEIAGSGLLDRTVLTGDAITPVEVEGAFLDADGDDLTFSFAVGQQAGTLASIGLRYDGRTGSIKGAISDAGDHEITVSADDGNGGTLSQSFTISAESPTGQADRIPEVLVPRLRGTGDVNETRIFADGDVVFTKGRAITPIDLKPLFNDPDNDLLTYEAFVGRLNDADNPDDTSHWLRLDHANIGLSIDNGVISGTMNELYRGGTGGAAGRYTDNSFEIVLRVNDGGASVNYAHLGLETDSARGSNVSVFDWGLLPTFNVTVNTAPELSTSSPLEDAFATRRSRIRDIDIAAAFEDPDTGSTLTYSVDGLEGTGLNFHSNAISGFFTGFSNGDTERTISVTATDEHGSATTDQFTLYQNTAPENGLFALSDRTALTNSEITPISVFGAFHDPDGDDLTYTVYKQIGSNALPDGLSFDRSTGLITGTLGDERVHDIFVDADDGKGGIHSQHFTITAKDPAQSQEDRDPVVLGDRLRGTGNVNETRIFVDNTVVFTKGRQITPIDIKPFFNDPDNDDLTYEAFVGRLMDADNPRDESHWLRLDHPNIRLSIDNGVITGTLTEDYEGGMGGARGRYTDTLFEIVLRVNDGGASVRYAHLGLETDPGRNSESVWDWGLLPTFNVLVNTAPQVSAAPVVDSTFTIGSTISEIDVSAGFDDPDAGSALNFSVEGLDETGLSFANGKISGTFTGFSGGETERTVIVTATDEHDIATTYQVRLYSNSAPESSMFALRDRTVLTGDTISPIAIDGAFHDPDGDDLTYTFSVETGVQQGSLSSIGLRYNQGSGLITGTIADAGTHAITVDAVDGNGDTHSQSFTLTAESPAGEGDRSPEVLFPRLAGTGDVNESRILEDDAVVFTKGRAIKPIDIKPLFNDPDNDELVYEAFVGRLEDVDNPGDSGEWLRLEHGIIGLSISNGVISGTFSENYEPGSRAATGRYIDDYFEVVLRVRDGSEGGVKYATLGLEENPARGTSRDESEWGLLPTFNVKVNTAPNISTHSALEDIFLTEGERIRSVDISRGFEDSDVGSKLTFSVDGLEQTGLSFTNNTIWGSFTGFSGSRTEMTIAVTATDEYGASTTDEIRLVRNLAPEDNVFTLRDRTTLKNQSITPISVDGAFRDPDGDDLSFSFSVGSRNGLPTGLTYNDSTGLITGTIANAGSHEITVVADDGKGGNHSQTFSITAKDSQGPGNRTPVLLVPLAQDTGDANETRILKDGTVVFDKGREIIPIDIRLPFNDLKGDELNYEAYVGRLNAADNPSDNIAHWISLDDSNFGLSVQNGVISGRFSENYSASTGDKAGHYTDDTFEIVLRIFDGPADNIANAKWVHLGLADDPNRAGSTSVQHWGLLPTFNVKVNTPPKVSSSSPLEDIFVEEGWTIPSIDVSGGFEDPDPGPGMTFSVEGLDGTGLRFADNVISGIFAGFSGGVTERTITVTATDEHGSQVTDHIKLQTNRDPENAPFNLRNRTVLTDKSITPISIKGAFQDPDGDNLTFSFKVGSQSGLPAGLSFNSSNGLITGTIANPGVHNITVEADDGNGGTHIQPFTITAVNSTGQANRDPVVLIPRLEGTGDVDETRVIADDTVVFTKGRAVTPIDIRHLFSDLDNDGLTYQARVGRLDSKDHPWDALAQGFWGFLDGPGIGLSFRNGIISGTLDENYSGTNGVGQRTDDTFEIVMRVFHGGNFANYGIDSESGADQHVGRWGLLPSFNVTVNTAPKISTSSPLENKTLTQGSEISEIDLSTGFVDPDAGSDLTFSVSGLAGTGLTVIDGVISGTFLGLSGSDTERTITVVATDQHGAATPQDFKITAVQPAPNSALRSVAEGEIVAVDIADEGMGACQRASDGGTPAIGDFDMELDHDSGVFPESPAGGVTPSVAAQDSLDLVSADFDSEAGGISNFAVGDGVGEFVEIDALDAAAANVDTDGDSNIHSLDMGQTVEGMESGFVDGSDYLFVEAFS